MAFALQVWWTLEREHKSRVYTHDMAKNVTAELLDIGSDAAVISLGVDGAGRVWMGHRGGLVQVWCAVTHCRLCHWSHMSPANIR